MFLSCFFLPSAQGFFVYLRSDQSSCCDEGGSSNSEGISSLLAHASLSENPIKGAGSTDASTDRVGSAAHLNLHRVLFLHTGVNLVLELPHQSSSQLVGPDLRLITRERG